MSYWRALKFSAGIIFCIAAFFGAMVSCVFLSTQTPPFVYVPIFCIEAWLLIGLFLWVDSNEGDN